MVYSKFKLFTATIALLMAMTCAIPNLAFSQQNLDDSNLPDTSELTADAVPLPFAQNFQGGQRAIENWFRNWNEFLLPAMQKMTAQWSTAILDRTRQYGSALDAQNFAEDVRAQELNEFESILDAEPFGPTCSIASAFAGSTSSGTAGASGSGGSSGGIATAAHVGKAVARGLASDMTNDALNKKGTPGETGPLGDYKNRFDLYATHFCDPEMNGGTANCAPSGPQIPNGDIAIENFLFADTIDMSEDVEKAAAYSLTRNLVLPNVPSIIPESALESYEGRAEMIKRRETQALRNIPISVVSNIVGRRSAIPGSDTSETVRALREAAGVKDENISDEASFNEIMQALTKERYFDADYFAEISGASSSQLQKEQLSVDILTSMTLRQIYLLQEQMNALMAARASNKFNKDVFKSIDAQ